MTEVLNKQGLSTLWGLIKNKQGSSSGDSLNGAVEVIVDETLERTITATDKTYQLPEQGLYFIEVRDTESNHQLCNLVFVYNGINELSQTYYTTGGSTNYITVSSSGLVTINYTNSSSSGGQYYQIKITKIALKKNSSGDVEQINAIKYNQIGDGVAAYQSDANPKWTVDTTQYDYFFVHFTGGDATGTDDVLMFMNDGTCNKIYMQYGQLHSQIDTDYDSDTKELKIYVNQAINNPNVEDETVYLYGFKVLGEINKTVDTTDSSFEYLGYIDLTNYSGTASPSFVIDEDKQEDLWYGNYELVKLQANTTILYCQPSNNGYVVLSPSGADSIIENTANAYGFIWPSSMLISNAYWKVYGVKNIPV